MCDSEAHRRKRAERTPKRMSYCAALLAAGVLVLAGCANAPRRSVAFAGDSITALGVSSLTERFEDRFEMSIDGQVGVTVEGYLDTAANIAATAPSVAVLNVGTNDVLLGFEPERSIAAYAELVSSFEESTCVVVVTVSESMVDGAGRPTSWSAIALNRGIRALVDDRECGSVVDWGALVATAGGAQRADADPVVVEDTIHPTPLGIDRLTTEIERALIDCGVLEPEPREPARRELEDGQPPTWLAGRSRR